MSNKPFLPELNREQFLDVFDIVGRAEKLYTKLYPDREELDRLDLFIALLAVHLSCGLDFEKLLDFDDFNFMHDIVGIINNIDPITGKLNNMFLPRCHLPQDEEESE